MPAKNVSEASTLRRSPRAPARVKVRFSDSGKEKPNRKRKQSSSEGRSPSQEQSQNQSVKAIPSTSKESKSAPTASKAADSRKVDKFCWICHSECDGQVCAICPRVYHSQCLNPKTQTFEDDYCPECATQSVDGTELEPDLLSKLDVALSKILGNISKKFPMFSKWTASEEKSKQLVGIWDLNKLYDELLTERSFKTTGGFLANTKWILHNCFIVYGPSDKMTSKAKALINECKDELVDFEACAQCFLRQNTDDSFSNLCDNEHPLVWAKIKGFSYWPAKVLKVIDSVANVRFFGSHDKAKVPINQCYCMSDKSPNDKDPKKAMFQSALEEKDLYVKKVVDRREKYDYFEPKTRFNPGNTNIITKSLKAANKSPGPKPKKAKLSTAADEASEADSQIVIEMDDSAEELNAVNDIEIIGELKKNAFLNNSHLLENSHDSPVFMLSVNPQVVNSLTPTISTHMNIDKTQHFHQPSEVEIVNANDFFSTSSPGNKNEDVHILDDEDAGNTLENVIELDEETNADFLKNDSQKSSDFQPNESCGSNNIEPKVESVTSNYSNHNSQTNNDVIDDGVTINVADKTAASKTVDYEKVNYFMHKHSPAMCLSLNNHLHNALMDTLFSHEACEQKELSLKAEIEKQTKKIAEIRQNSSIIDKSIRTQVRKELERDHKIEKQKWEEQRKKLIEDHEQEVKLRQEVARKDHETFVANIDAKHKAQLKAAIDKLNKEKRIAMESAKKKCKKEYEDKINSIKRTQWCAFCLKEARFFCCWNTSYCNDECQSKHWPQHVDLCENICRFKEAFPDATAFMTPCSEMGLGGKMVKKTSDSTNSPTLPMLRPNGQKFNSGLSINTNVPSSSYSQTKSTSANISHQSPVAKANSVSESQKESTSDVSNSETQSSETNDGIGNKNAVAANSNLLDICKTKGSKVSNQSENVKTSNTFENKKSLLALFNLTKEKKVVSKSTSLSENKKIIPKISTSSNDNESTSKLSVNAKAMSESPKGSPNTTSKVCSSPEFGKIPKTSDSAKDEKTPNSKDLTSVQGGKTPAKRITTTTTKIIKTSAKKNANPTESGKILTRKSLSLNTGTRFNTKLANSSEGGKSSVVKVSKLSETKQLVTKNSSLFSELKSPAVAKNSYLDNTKTSPITKATVDGVKTTNVKVVSSDEKNKNPTEETLISSKKKNQPSDILSTKSTQAKDMKGGAEKTSADSM